MPQASTVKSVVPNLRFRWKEELAPYSDEAIAMLWEDYELSEDFGSNDEKLPNWFPDLPSYEKAVK